MIVNVKDDVSRLVWGNNTYKKAVSAIKTNNTTAILEACKEVFAVKESRCLDKLATDDFEMLVAAEK